MKLFFKRNYLLVFLIFLTFLKGAVWATSTPLFQAPDEQYHYATVQYYALPEGYQPKSNDFPIGKSDIYDFSTQNFSPELKNFLEKNNFKDVRFRPDTKTPFTNESSFGIDEKELRSQNLPRFIESFPAWYVHYGPLYYKSMSFIENAFFGWSIIERVFLIRMFSFFLGTLLVLTAYFIFRELFFGKTESTMLAGIVSFQPMLTFINSSINVDPLLFLSFTLFILGSVRLLRNKIDIWSFALLLGAAALGILTKPPGYFMTVALLFLAPLYFLLHQKDKLTGFSRKKLLLGSILFLAAAISAIFLLLKSYFPNLLKPLFLLPKYLVFQLGHQVSVERSVSYWGNFGWLDAPLSRFWIYGFWLIFFLALVGVARYFAQNFFAKKTNGEKSRIFLFQMAYFVFLVVGVSVMIHFVNLEQSNPGNLADPTATIGTQGRYFFPAIAAQLALLVLGISFLFQSADRKKIIFLFLAGMVFLNFVSLLNYVIPRFYL